MEFWFSFRSSQGDFWLNSDLTFCWDRANSDLTLLQCRVVVILICIQTIQILFENRGTFWLICDLSLCQGSGDSELSGLWLHSAYSINQYKRVNFSIFHTRSSCFTYDKELTPCSYRNRTFNSDYAFQRMTQPPNLNSARRFDYKFQ